MRCVVGRAGATEGREDSGRNPVLPLRAVADLFDDSLPALVDAGADFGGDLTEGAVGEGEEGAAVFFGEAVLDVGHHGGGHEHGAGEFEEGRGLDDLDVAPEVAGLVAQVAEVAAAGPGLELEAEG